MHRVFSYGFVMVIIICILFDVTQVATIKIMLAAMLKAGFVL